MRHRRFWFAVLLLPLMAFAAYAQPPARSASYQSWAICVDRSLSPAEEQFRKLIGILQAIVEYDVTYNDVVWLIEIESDREPVRIFPMPGRSNRRSDGIDEVARLRQAKVPLLEAIRQMSQVSGNTNLRIPLEAALDILRSQTGTSRRVLIVGSDFLTDKGLERVSADPPTFSRDRAATGVDALLFVTYPKSPYLHLLSASPSALFEKIEVAWAGYLSKQAASSVTVRLVDSIHITAPSSQKGERQ